MKGEIDRDFYCSGTFFGGSEWCNSKNRICVGISGDNIFCSCYHRKRPTPEQYRTEYGEDYPERGAVYFMRKEPPANDTWYVERLGPPEHLSHCLVVCACTPFGPPPDDWRPE